MLGLPFIWGYKPAENYQVRLFEIIGQRLTEPGLLMRLSNQIGDVTVPRKGIEYGRPPQRHNKLENITPVVRRILTRFDPVARDAKSP